jgi:hypothetical protein
MKENYEELELNNEQCERLDEIDNAVYELCQVMAEKYSMDELPWDMEIIGEIAECAACVLVEHGNKVRYPSIVTEPDGKQYIEEYYTM